MLEIRNLTKVYRSKTGEEVRALDNVSVTFPESGMIFILGKSGSGKSTLLNIMGGLDSYDSGEFVIKGKSSKDFAGSDFDAYRNTFIGFIFQEYNVLDDFTVGANIGLALELQGKKATDETINRILSQVDLLNFADRKPNELSGGQKQRVAIARALVKEPQIIMADEPTGALDSNTGKQIFDTLKELSREKLVLIVSHDRDFAERYADRIIELSDGRILSDVTKHERQSVQLSEGIQQINGQILRIKGGYRLTAADLQMINDYLQQNQNDIILSGDGRINDELRSAAGISADGHTSVFEGTDQENDYTLKEYKKEDSRFIRSKLPMKNALRMGGSSLKHKKFRLVMTILLSLVAFALFGFADTLGAYDKLSAAVASIRDSNIRTASVDLGIRREITDPDGDVYVSYVNALLNESDIAFLKEKTGLEFVPVYTGGEVYNRGYSIASQFQSYESNDIYNGKISGLASINTDLAASAGLSITGRLPEKEGEIAITELTYRQFNEYGFVNQAFDEKVAAGSLTMTEGSASSIIGKHITLNNLLQNEYGLQDKTFVIVGVVNTNFDYTRYDSLLPTDTVTEDTNALTQSVLFSEAQNELTYGFHMLGFLQAEELISVASTVSPNRFRTPMSGFNAMLQLSVTVDGATEEEQDSKREEFQTVAGSNALNVMNITWLDGTTRKALGVNEIVVPVSMFNRFLPSEAELTMPAAELAVEASRLYGADNWALTDPSATYYERLKQAAELALIEKALENPAVLEQVSLHYTYDEIFRQFDEFGNPIEPVPVSLTKEEAKQYWIDYWYSRGNRDTPYYDPSAAEPVTRDQAETTLLSALLPFMANFYGVTLPEIILEDRPDAVVQELIQPLFRLSEENDSYILLESSVRSILNSIYGYIDVQEHKLWENEAFVQIMLEQDFIDRNQWESGESDQARIVYEFYSSYWLDRAEEDPQNAPVFGTYTADSLWEMSREIIQTKAGITLDDLLGKLRFSLTEQNYDLENTNALKDLNLTVVGTFSSNYYTDMIISDTVLNEYMTWEEAQWGGERVYTEVIAEHEAGLWTFVVAPLDPTDEATVETLATLSFDEESDLQFTLQNGVMSSLASFNEFIEVGALIFLYVGIGFAVFSALLLMNFISTSISYKKREIGVLRAVGARSSDVFKIFFSEALIIALINFVLSIAAAITAVIATNNVMRSQGIQITLLNFGPRQVILMLVISIVVAILASFLPVYNIAKRKPIDAIKDR